MFAVLPGLIAYTIRVGQPDFTWDVLNYHITNGDRLLDGMPWLRGDFFPSILPVNPAPDLLFSVGRWLLGYRLGTLPNLFALLWCAKVTDRIVSSHFPERWTRTLLVTAICTCEFMPYLLSFYMVDILAVPLLLGALEIALQRVDLKEVANATCYAGLLLGTAIAFKLTKLIFAVPIGLLLLWNYRGHRFSKVLLIVVAILPSLPHCIFLYEVTGNPLFPYYNAIFRSGFAPLFNVKDLAHGPPKIWMIPLWPLIGTFAHFRLGMVHEASFYSGRLPLGFIAALLSLRSKSADLRSIALLLLTSCLLWSATAGELRYAIYLECLAGIMVVAFLKEHTRPGTHLLPRAIVLLLAVQTCLAYRNCLVGHETLIGKYPVQAGLSNPRAYATDASLVLKDRDLDKFLSRSELVDISRVDLWIAADDATSGLEVLLKPRIPIISVHQFVDLIDYMEEAKTRQKAHAAVYACAGCSIYTLVYASHVDKAVSRLRLAGLSAESTTAFPLPFYSHASVLDLVLIKVRAAP